MLDITKINFSHKKLAGKQHTWNSKKWYEEDDGIVLFQHAKEIWVDTISETPPEEENDIVKYVSLELQEDKTVQGRRAFLTVDDEGNRIRGFIPPSYGLKYTLKLFINGQKIPTAHESNWMFDYANGVLTFENTPPLGTVVISLYEYVGRSFQQYLDAEFSAVSIGILGLDIPQLEYTIQHNMGSYDVEAIIYVFDEVDGINYWKKDVIPLILLDENRIRLQLSESKPIRFIIKSYDAPDLV